MGILWPHSNTAPRTNADKRAPGALAYFFEAGTSTPRTIYQDADLTTPHAHPVVADAYGRFPSVFIDFGSYRERVLTGGGTQLWNVDEVPNPAPTDPAEGVDADSLLKVGEVFFKFADGVRTGAVRANGRTIGNTSSGASERANPDTLPLYTELYNSLDNAAAPVSGGRGANAAADFAANKTLTLPDLRGRSPFGLDSMGATPAGRIVSPVPNFADANKPGYAVGANTHQLTVSELATVTPSGTISQITPAGTISQITPAGSITMNPYTPAGAITVNNDTAVLRATGSGGIQPTVSASTVTTSTISATFAGTQATLTGSFSGTPVTPTFTGNPVTPTFTGNPVTPTFTGTPFGSNAAHNNVPSAVLGTWYIKL